ncbi:MAG TPA: hypothetical protein VE010_10370, partial [Thermoanaerobaculia bacterium]|nr:hypothetical protein [Thermoanaerobaculia bacterium]
GGLQPADLLMIRRAEARRSTSVSPAIGPREPGGRLSRCNRRPKRPPLHKNDAKFFSTNPIL